MEMRLEQYLSNMSSVSTFHATGMSRETYLDLLETVFQVYPVERIMSRKKRCGAYMDLHTYSRLTSVLACLLAGGRLPHMLSLWMHMMTECCKEIVSLRKDVIADFAIKEIMFAFKLMKEGVPENKLKEWKSDLKKIDPYVHYAAVVRPGDPDNLHNINIYNMSGEFLRETEGLTDTSDYFSKHWLIQLNNFDENGMYMDPGCPLLYDITTRCQTQLMMKFGYNGPYFSQLDGNLRKAGIMTLLMQSSAFELPYGGRSSQFLFGEALIAANCEYEAVRHQREGNYLLAGMFKRAAHLAVQSTVRWLELQPPRHIKNMYPVESRWGTEGYAYYDKYMITFGSFLALAYCFSDDSIPEKACPSEIGGYVFETSENFHKIFAIAGGYSVEIDVNADLRYDATGLGRIHHTGIPSELGLSTPLTSENSYELGPGINRTFGSISPGWEKPGGGMQFLSELSEGLNYRLTVIQESRTCTEFKLEYSGDCLQGCSGIKQLFRIDRNGVQIHFEWIEPVSANLYVQLPLLATNGSDRTLIDVQQDSVAVSLGKHRYKAFYNGKLVVNEAVYGNRNGEYRMSYIQSEGASCLLLLQFLNDPSG
ncbi:hypothetical protein [Paenibacillus alkalitolerans]|uniref:hypothetical protein n=1 Tax=Paenibacillus alkalitolerans TaxID=2799335 RepID=UPI0018F63304|nr:hypothetical protein [Paenibacillus alkalitolerans]